MDGYEVILLLTGDCAYLQWMLTVTVNTAGCELEWNAGLTNSQLTNLHEFTNKPSWYWDTSGLKTNPELI